jgi:large subunit ribosomal protein L3
MPSRKSPRKGSLQFWPRKRSKKILPRVNWEAIDDSESKLKGFICYKVGMKSALVLDNGENSLTKGKKINVPVTILSCPKMKILSLRFYKNKKVAKDFIVSKDKELKSKIKVPKEVQKIDSIDLSAFDELSLIVYSLVNKTKLKKTLDLVEIGVSGSSIEDKFAWVKENLNKEFSLKDFFNKNKLVDFRGVTTGRGLQGPVKRFGISFKSHKSEKGVRRPGSIGPWHPARVTFRVPMAGQTGFNTRVQYNNYLLEILDASKKISNIKNFGVLESDYIIVTGSVMGPTKRQVILTSPLRLSSKQLKKNYGFIELR